MNVLIERLQKRFHEDKNAKLDVYQERLWNIKLYKKSILIQQHLVLIM